MNENQVVEVENETSGEVTSKKKGPGVAGWLLIGVGGWLLVKSVAKAIKKRRAAKKESASKKYDLDDSSDDADDEE